MKQKDHKPLSEKDLAKAVKEILLSPLPTKAKQENRKPTKEQINQRFKLVSRNK